MVSARVVAYAEQKDMCVLELTRPVSLEEVSLAEKSAARGDAVYVVGFPGAADYLSDTVARTGGEATITDGIVSATRSATIYAQGKAVRILQVSAAINSGNSGGRCSTPTAASWASLPTVLTTPKVYSEQSMFLYLRNSSLIMIFLCPRRGAVCLLPHI